MKELLRDFTLFEFSPDQINEALANNNGRLIVSGILQRSNTRNQNGRIYPKEVLMRESKKYENLIKESRALGELDHPESSVISLKNASHNIKEIYWDGDDLMGKVEVLTTPNGNILRELFKNGIKLGISSRGMGSIKEVEEGEMKGAKMVQDDFDLLGWDFVSNPSTHGAFMNESVEAKQECTTFCRAESLVHEILKTLND